MNEPAQGGPCSFRSYIATDILDFGREVEIVRQIVLCRLLSKMLRTCGFMVDCGVERVQKGFLRDSVCFAAELSGTFSDACRVTST